jgi:hypothetical protein
MSVAGPGVEQALADGRYAGFLLPIPVPPDLGAARLVPGEEGPNELGFTIYRGPAGSSGAGVTTWCALTLDLPAPGVPGFGRGPWLRRRGAEGLSPLCTAAVSLGQLVLRFPAGGAPFVPSPGAPQGERRAAELARRALVHRLRHASGLRRTARWTGAGSLLSVFPELEALPEIERLPGGGPLHGRLGAVRGPCAACRHAHRDPGAQALACRFLGDRAPDATCEVTAEGRGGARLYAFEPWDGTNATWGVPGEVSFDR